MEKSYCLYWLSDDQECIAKVVDEKGHNKYKRKPIFRLGKTTNIDSYEQAKNHFASHETCRKRWSQQNVATKANKKRGAMGFKPSFIPSVAQKPANFYGQSDLVAGSFLK